MADATPYQPTILSAVDQATDWFDSAVVIDGIALICKVTGTSPYAVEVSNDERATKPDDVVVAATFSVSIAKVLMGPMPRFFRVRKTSGAGTVAVSLGKAKNWSGKMGEVNAASRHAGSGG